MRANLSLKITALFLGVIFIILLGVYLYLEATLRARTLERIRGFLSKNLSFAAAFLELQPDSAGGTEQLDVLAEKIGRDLEARVTIIDMNGIVLGDSYLPPEKAAAMENHLYRPEVQTAIRQGSGESRRYSTTVNKEMLYMARTFEHASFKGIIRMAIPLSEIEQLSRRLRGMLAAAFLAAFLIAVLISGIISQAVTNRIKEMSRAAAVIAGGNYAYRLPESGRDELKELAAAFNYMTRQVKQKIEEITAGRSRLEAVLLSMAEGVMVVDKQGKIIFFNRSLKEMFSLGDDALSRAPIEVIRSASLQELADNALRLNRKVESREIPLTLEKERIMLVCATAITGESENAGAVLVFHDVTELRRLEKIRQDFAANVSHELRTPVTNIRGYAETLLGGAVDDKKHAREFLQIILTESERLSALINDVLDLAKLESGKIRTERKLCFLETVIRRTIESLRPQAEHKQIRVHAEIAPDLAPLRADEEKLTQVVFNLLDNAVKFTPRRGMITIAAKMQDGLARVDITDTGAGIPEEDLPRIFERFYRVDKSRSRELGGTGLGLAIVKHIVQGHHGEVFVCSAPGKGSTFSFTIPLVG